MNVCGRLIVMAFLLLTQLFYTTADAQLATYPLRTGTGMPPNGTALAAGTSPLVTAGTLVDGGSVVPSNYNSTGYRVKTQVGGTGVPWPSVPTDGFHFDIPLSPVAGNDFTITGITGWDSIHSYANSATRLFMIPYFRVNNTGPWRPLNGAAPVTIANTPSGGFNFGPVNETFYSGNSYVVRFYVYATAGNDRNDNFRLKFLVFNGTTSAPPAAAPSVSTLTATASGLYTANITGSYQSGPGFHTVYQAGFVWATTANPTLGSANSNTAGSGGAINSTLTGLTAGTTYFVRSYITTQFGTFYGAQLSFTTLPPTVPTLNTAPVTNLLSNKAISGGINIDSGGVVISEKGLVWSTSPNPQVNSFIGGNKGIFPTGGSLSFSDWMKQLQPATTYYVRAYAINAIGIGYGNEIQFTTAAAAPVLTAIPGILDLGENLFNSNPIVLNYFLSGNLLNPASGNITITVSGGFQISLTGASASFSNSIVLPYAGGRIVSTPIYVSLPTTSFGSFTGFITHSGGGVTAVNADTVYLSGSITQSPDDITNRGTDFWLGFGYQEKMDRESGDPAESKMSVYIAAGDQPATVVVELPGIPGAPTFPRTINIPANSITEVTGFPTGDPNDEFNPSGLPDARLFYTGVSNRGVHVYSTNGAPVAVWLYTYANNNSAAGSMVFPTSTWNSSYTVQAFGARSNVGGAPNSFFFVIANENNTEVIFTPTQPIVDSSAATVFNDGHVPANIRYQAGGNYGNPDTVILNRGQVFNAMGFVQGSGSNSALGLDLSGTFVRTNCDKKITVFGGNGRCLVSTPVRCPNPTSGSDNLIQQMIPQVAWGTKYFTVPTKSMEYNLYRIYVQDPATVVKINNGAPLTGLVSNLYYVVETNQPMMIDSDRPISVTQFITAGNCASNGGSSTIGSNGYGDPEMIILSAAQQAINKVSVYSPNFKNGTSGASYINVVIRTGGISSFRLNPTTNPTQMVDTGSSSYTGVVYGSSALIPIANAFKPYPADPSYSWAKFKVTTGATHRMQSDSGFNAIAYGMSDGESYGFNAGTAVRNLNSLKLAINPNGTDSSASAVRTCINNPVRLRIALPYNPFLVDSIVWYPENVLDPRITPNNRNKGETDIATGKARFIRSYVVEGRTFYEYESPVTYQFRALGTYRIIANAFGTFASDCPGEDRQRIPVIVGRDNINFTYTAACGNPAVSFTNNTLPMAGSTISSVRWDFGDGNSSTSATNPVNHTYALGNQTLFNVVLSTVNSWGCNSSDSLLVDISGGIKPRFTIAPRDTICSGTQVTFDPALSEVTGATAGLPVRWTWNFGEGADVVINGGSSPVQTYTYNNAGVFPVQLNLETSNGCIGIFKDTVVVEATPVAAINTNPSFVCLGAPASYQDASTITIGNIAGWNWSFDDGTTSNIQNPSKTWLTPGVHTTTLTVTSTGGCPSSNTATHTINVNQLPRAGFRYDLNCTSRTITLTDTSNGFGVSITGWNWDFGDGATSTLQNPTHVYATAGTYTVTLTVTTANGCTSVVPESITVTIAASPVASFDVPGNTCLPGASPAFNNTTTISDGTIATVTYIWNFGDGTGDLLSPPNPVSPTHVFPGTGPYTVSLTAISQNGCTNTTTRPYSAIFAAPVANITPVAEICVNGTVSFSSATSTAPGSTITGWSWDFGDGTTSTQQNPTHTYSTAGVKTVQLTVTTAAGCTSAIDTLLVTVNALPTADFSDTINCTTRSVGFTDLSVPNSGVINQWNWTLGTAGTSTQQNPTQVFPTEGPHSITLTVRTDKGCVSAPVTRNINISARPVAGFDLPGNICLPNAVALFSNTTTISDGTLAQVTYEWNFGDGNSLPSPAAASPSHTYTATGPFTVTLTAVSNNGCRNAISRTYNSVYAQPVAVITAPSGICIGNAANFSASSSTAPASSVSGWTWDFGDAPAPGSSNQQNPTYTYVASGARTVTLTVSSAAGCSSAPATAVVNVNISPVAGFTYDAIRCEDSLIRFNDASVANAAGGITEWAWNFGDGGTLTQTTAAPATHVFASSQSYTVTLSVKNANGCLSAAPATARVVINPNPVPDFTVTNACIPPGNASFAQNATISSGNILSWTWNFGVSGAPAGSGATPTFTYSTGGAYQVSMQAVSDSGCTASTSREVKIFTAPTTAFDVSNLSSLCSNLPVTITDRSVVNGYGAVDKIDIFWNQLGAPAVKQTVSNPAVNATYSNQYTEFGTPATVPYRITVRAYNGDGCFTDASQDISLLASPKALLPAQAPVCQEADAYLLTGAGDQFNLPGSGIFSGNGVADDGTFTPAAAGPGSQLIRYTYTTLTGCTSFAEQPVVVNPTPVINFQRSVINVLEGDVLQLNPTITNGASFFWSPSTYLNNPRSANPSGLPTADITYQLLVTSDKGCQATETVDVKVVRKYVVPNTFTPNGDGNHDRWEIENLALYPDVRVRVFSRSGQLVFESYGYNTPWDGRYKGTELPFGTYYYVIETGGGRKPQTGYVTIIR